MFVACKACGKGCDAMTHCCNDACKGCCKACNEVGDFICPHDKPSPIFTLFSLAMNIAIIAVGALGLAKKDDQAADTTDVNRWLAVACAIAVGNIVFAFYIYRKFSQATTFREQEGEGRKSACKAACNLLAYDCGVFANILLLIFQVVWSFMDDRFKCVSLVAGGCDTQDDSVDLVRILIWVFVFFGLCVVSFSVCTETCNSKKRASGYAEIQPAYQAQPQHQAVPVQQGQQPVQYGGNHQ